jgi:Zn-dependent protease
MAVGLSMYDTSFEWIFLVITEPRILIISALIFTAIFVSHELAHKAAAKRYGLWAEFRLSLVGTILTLMSIAPTPIKFVSPGAVMMVGVVDKKVVGITALAGPLTSIVFTALLFIAHFFVPSSSFASIILRGASLGAWIAVLNLIPFGILDGAKVLWWNKPVWAASFFTSIILMLIVLRTFF